MAKHPTTLACWGSHFGGLAREIAGLRYDALAQMLTNLARSIGGDADKDRIRDRPKLADALDDLATYLEMATLAAEAAWEICEPYEKE